MKKIKVEELRERVKQMFAAQSVENARRAGIGEETEFDDAANADFEELWQSTKELIIDEVASEHDFMAPDDEYLTMLERLMAFPLCRIYENYELREDVTDAEIMACAGAIAASDLEKLDHLRAKESRSRYNAFQGDSFFKSRSLYQNVYYLLLLYASQAKSLGTREGACHFLRAASMIKKYGHNKFVIKFLPDQIDAIISDFRSGIDEVRLQFDYNALEDWSTYRKVQKEIVDRENKRVAEEGEK